MTELIPCWCSHSSYNAYGEDPIKSAPKILYRGEILGKIFFKKYRSFA